jgi:hypothetical protein
MPVNKEVGKNMSTKKNNMSTNMSSNQDKQKLREAMPIIEKMAKINKTGIECKHIFWKNRVPENCFRCGLTETEIIKQKIKKDFLDYLKEKIDEKK